MFRVQGLGSSVWGLELRVWGLGFRVQSSSSSYTVTRLPYKIRVWGLGFTVKGSGLGSWMFRDAQGLRGSRRFELLFKG